jgi:hypothetical protein
MKLLLPPLLVAETTCCPPVWPEACLELYV